MEIDRFLLARARQLRNGANVDRIKTLIFCYEESVHACNAGRTYRSRFEDELRLLVLSMNRREAVLANTKRLGKRSLGLHAACEVLDRKIDKFFGKRCE